MGSCHALQEYLFVLGRDGLVIPSRPNTYKYIKHNEVLHTTYSISQEGRDFLE